MPLIVGRVVEHELWGATSRGAPITRAWLVLGLPRLHAQLPRARPRLKWPKKKPWPSACSPTAAAALYLRRATGDRSSACSRRSHADAPR